MDDIEDLLGVLKFWKLGKAIFNFKQAGLLRKVGVVATVATLGLGAFFTFADMDGAVIEGLEMTPVDTEVYAGCLDTYDRMDVYFTEVSNKIGCACTAKLATSEFSVDDLTIYLNAQAILVTKFSREWTAKSDNQRSEISAQTELAYGKLRTSSGMDPKPYDHLVSRMEAIDDVCDQYASYEGDKLVQMAQLRPIDFVDAEAVKQVDAVQIQLRGMQSEELSASRN